MSSSQRDYDVESTRIERPSFAELPSLEELVRLAEGTEWLLVQVPVVVTVGENGKRSDETLPDRERYIRELTPLLPAHRVWDSGFLPDEGFLPAARRNEVGSRIAGIMRLSTRRIVTEQALEDHLPLLTSAAVEYRALANALMRRLARQLGTDADEFAVDISWHRHEQIGRLSDDIDGEWDYFFHGVDCAFRSLDSGVVVEARLGCGADFGVFDPWFYIKFMKTTLPHRKEYLPILEILRDWWDNGKRAFEYMERRGVLRHLGSGPLDAFGWVMVSDVDE